MIKRTAIALFAALTLCLTGCAQPSQPIPSETGESAGREAAVSQSAAQPAANSDFGNFACKTLTGETVTQEIFADKSVTLVNLWATWCGPCIAELPDLQALSAELAGSDAQVIGIVEDTYDPENADGNAEVLDLANYVREEGGLTYPNLVPDQALEEGIIATVDAFPTTWFVDSAGNVIGDPVVGSHSKEDYMAVIKQKLAAVA